MHHQVDVQRRTLRVLVLAQMLGGAGLAAGATVGALLAQQMLGNDGAAGLPTALFTLGSASAAYLVGSVSQRHGRRVGLGAGFLTGGLGAAGVVVAAAIGSVWLLFASLFVYGAGSATNLQARYAGTDLAESPRRGAAVSVALLSTTIGAVAGPNLVGPLGSLASRLGLPALTGMFLLAAVAYWVAGAALVTLLRPDPLLFARQLARQSDEQSARDAHTAASPTPDATAHVAHRPSERGLIAGAATLVLSQVAMVAIMTMTPVHMEQHSRGLQDVGLVIGAHIAAMYLPSPLTGRLVDRVGPLPIATASTVVLVTAACVAAWGSANSLATVALGLLLLGLGWNLGLISGTALVVDSTSGANKARTQGTIDVLVALAGAASGALSGFLTQAAGYTTMALTTAMFTALLIPALAATSRHTTRQPGTVRGTT